MKKTDRSQLSYQLPKLRTRVRFPSLALDVLAVQTRFPVFLVLVWSASPPGVHGSDEAASRASGATLGPVANSDRAPRNSLVVGRPSGVGRGVAAAELAWPMRAFSTLVEAPVATADALLRVPDVGCGVGRSGRVDAHGASRLEPYFL